MDASQIAITTNEISRDPVTAIEEGSRWGIRNYELKVVMSGRVPRIPEAEIERIEGALSDYGAKAVCVSPGLYINTVWGSVEEEEHTQRLLPESIAFAHRFEVDRMIVFAGRRPDEGDPAAPCPADVIERLRAAAELAHREGITLVLENMGTTWADTSAHTADILQGVDHPAFRANWDPANAYVIGDYTAYPEGYALLADWVAHLHLKSAVLDESLSRGWRFATLLDGDIDWPGQLRALGERGYDGYLTIETHYPPWVRNSRTNYEQLVRLLAQV